MQTVNFKCGHCGNLMGVSSDFLGQQVRCPHCQQVVVAPAAGSPDQTLQLPPSDLTGRSPEETALLPPLSDEASIFHDDDATDPLFAEPKPPPLEVPAPFNAPTLALESGSVAAPVTAPPPDASSLEPDVPDWMKPAVSGPVASANGVMADAPRPASAPRRSSLGLLLFITLVFMPLVLYSILVTILAILIYGHNAQSEPPPDPREYLIDTQGDHPGAKKSKSPTSKVLETDMQKATAALPPPLRIKLGETLQLGQLQVRAEGVERGTVEMTTPGFEKADHIETLILRLHLKNVSDDTTFYPMDYWFTRKWKSGQGNPPLTVLLAGEQLRYFGGPAVWNHGTVNSKSNPERRNYLKNSHYDRELQPGEEMDTFVCVNGNDPKFDELADYQGPFVWHVQVRRGLVHWKDHAYPATAVFGVEFTDGDIKQAN